MGGRSPGCVGQSFGYVAVTFGYVVGDIGVHLLEKVWSILVARSLGNEARNWDSVAGQN
jgi:hypothetical protein